MGWLGMPSLTTDIEGNAAPSIIPICSSLRLLTKKFATILPTKPTPGRPQINVEPLKSLPEV